MAKKSSTTSSKNKDAKKPAAKTAKATKAAPKKAVTKDKSAKTTEAQKPLASIRKPKKQTAVTAAMLKKVNLVLAVFYVLQAVVLVVLSKAYAVPVWTSYLTNDDLAARAAGKPVFVTGVRHLFDINLVYVVTALLFVAALAHLLFATRARKAYERGLEARVNRSEWAASAVTSTILVLLIALIVGFRDISALIMVAVLNVLMNGLYLALEIYARFHEVSRKRLYFLGKLAGVTAWIVFAIYLVGATLYGTNNLPSYIYAVAAVGLIGYATKGLVTYWQVAQKGKWGNYLRTERFLVTISFLINTIIVWVLYATLFSK